MLAPLSSNTPVRTPGDQFSHQSRPKKRYELSKEGRKGLVAADGQQTKKSVRVLRINGTAISAGRQPSSLESTPAASMQVVHTSQTAPNSKSKARSRALSPASSARVKVMSLPGQNKGKPTLDDVEAQRLEDVSLPGQNQIAPTRDEIGPPAGPGPAPAEMDMPSGMFPPGTAPPGPSGPASPPGPASPSGPQSVPGPPSPGPVLTTGMTPSPGVPPMGPLAPVGGPPPPGMRPPSPGMRPPSPGMRPPSPAMPPSAAIPPPPPAMQPPPPGSPPTPPSPPQSPPTTLSSASTASLPLTTGVTSSYSSYTTSTRPSEITSSSKPALSPVSSFVTITRSEVAKGEAPITVALPNTTLAPAVEASMTSAVIPQSINAPKSISSSTAVVTAATSIASAMSNGGGLNSMAKTLLIVFVILGVLSLVVAIIIFVMINSRRKRSRTQPPASNGPDTPATRDDTIGVTTHITAEPNDNPFLTASEKAIVSRVSVPNTMDNPNAHTRFSDAVSSFIEKSRRMTYKISP